MEEMEKLFTVEDIAVMTRLTSRTIRNYLKNGILQGQKIGGQWRFTMDNVKNMFRNGSVLDDVSRKNRQSVMDFIGGTAAPNKEKVQVCTIVDYACSAESEGRRLYEKLVKVINSRKDKSAPAAFNYEYLDKGNKARFTLFGDPQYIVETLELLR